MLAAALVAVVAAAVVLSTSGDPVELPAPLERVAPAPGGATLPQTTVEIDLPVGYEIELWIDGARIPDADVAARRETGLFTWTPSGVLTPGDHDVLVLWNRSQGLPDTGSFAWTFRVQ